jgi:hypothetical protein
LILLNAKFKIRADTIINKKLCIDAADNKYGVYADKKRGGIAIKAGTWRRLPASMTHQE